MAESETRGFNRLDYTYKVFVIITLSIAAIILAKDIIVPMAFAALLSMVMLPGVRMLERRRLGTALSITIVLFFTMVGLGLFIWLIVNQVAGLIYDLPNLQTKFEAFVNETSLTLRQEFGVSTSEQTKMLEEMMKAVSIYLGGVLLSTTAMLSMVIQIPIYIFLFLIYRSKFKAFFLKFIPASQEEAWRTDIERVVHGYLSGLFLVVLIVAVLNSVGLLIVGIDHAIFFGVLSGILVIIPYVGISIGALLPFIMALITKDSLWYPIGVLIVFAIVSFFEGNIISPRITGSKVRINAFAAIIALLIGGKMLGIAGMILAVPAIGLLKILLAHSEHLKPFVILLEDKPQLEPTQISEPVTDPLTDSPTPVAEAVTEK